MSNPKALGVHVFAGSFSIGVQNHFDVEAHLEYDGYASETAQANFNFPIVESKEQWPENPGQRFSDVEFMFANPPCAPFSNQANTENGVEDARVGRIREVVELASRIQPKIWAFESVTQAWTQGKCLVGEIHDRARNMGYNVTHYLHDVNFHGVPQTRKRYLFIAHDMPMDWDLPEPDRKGIEESDVLEEEPPGEQIAPQKEGAREAWEEVIGELEPGGFLRDLWQEKYENRNGWTPFQTVRRMREEGPVCAALGGTRFIHPERERFLTVRELARLMGYPDSYEFHGSSAIQNSYYVAKGVVAPVGEWLARNAKAHLDVEPYQTDVTTMIDARNEQFAYRFLTP